MTSTDGPVKKLLQQGPQNNSVFWASLAGLLQVALAVSAGVIAYWQVTEQWAVQNEQAARDAYKDFLKISMDHPTLSGGYSSDYEYTEQDDEQYFWYVTLMTTFEQVLAYVPNIDAWIDLLELQVDIHCEYYSSDDFQPELYQPTAAGSGPAGWRRATADRVSAGLAVAGAFGRAGRPRGGEAAA